MSPGTNDLLNKIAQLIMVGFEGDLKDFKLLLDQYPFGGVVLFSRNIESPLQTCQLIRELRDHCRSPLFVAVDQEGGRVTRLKKGFTPLPPFRKLGEQNDPDLAYRYGMMMGAELSAVGFNLNFAPVLDVDSNPQNPVIGDRSLGADPERVGELGSAFSLGLQSKGVMAVGKHFPGHGDTDSDSHYRLPVVNAGAQTLTDRELIPFKKAISQGLDGIMASHVVYPAWDRKNPATTSNRIIAEILRKNLRFSGLVFSDDFEMEALVQDDLGRIAVEALNAGVEQILVCRTPEKQIAVLEALVKAVEKKVISNEKLKIIEKILVYKRKYSLPIPASEDRLAKVLRHQNHLNLINEF